MVLVRVELDRPPVGRRRLVDPKVDGLLRPTDPVGIPVAHHTGEGVGGEVAKVGIECDDVLGTPYDVAEGLVDAILGASRRDRL